MSTTHGVPVVSRPDEREHVEYYGYAFDVALRAESTGGQFFSVAQTLRPEDAPPFHVHTLDDEIWIVTDGTFRFWLGGTSLDTAETHDVGPGSIVYGPRDVPHTFQALGHDASCVILWSPADGQGYFLNVGAAEGREDFDHPERLAAVGVRLVDRAPVDGR